LTRIWGTWEKRVFREIGGRKGMGAAKRKGRAWCAGLGSGGLAPPSPIVEGKKVLFTAISGDGDKQGGCVTQDRGGEGESDRMK